MSKGSSETNDPFPEIPGFRIEGVLGRGSVAVVYRATQLAMNRAVAVKVLHKDLIHDPRTAERLMREARLAAKLNHPHIVRAHDVGASGGILYFVMDCIDGVSLRELMRRGPLDPHRVLAFMIEIAGALGHLHKNHIVHRDVKPANILVNAQGSALLADLGLAKAEFDASQSSRDRSVGTPQYMSPEQLTDPRTVDIRSDIFSLGATFYHLVAGVSPFDAESVGAVLTRVLYENPPPPGSRNPAIPSDFDAVILKMLAKDVDQRYASPFFLLRDLKALATGQKPPGVDVPVADDRRKKFMIAAAVLVAIGVGGGVLGRAILTPDDGHSDRSVPESRVALSASQPTGEIDGTTLARTIIARKSPSRDDLTVEFERRLDRALLALLEKAEKKVEIRNVKEAKRLIDEEPAGAIVATFGISAADLPDEYRRRIREFQDRGHIRIAALQRADQAGNVNAVIAAFGDAVAQMASEKELRSDDDVRQKLRELEIPEKEFLGAEHDAEIAEAVERFAARYRAEWERLFREGIAVADDLRQKKLFRSARNFVAETRKKLNSVDARSLFADLEAAERRIDTDVAAMTADLAAAVARLDRFAVGGFPEWHERRFGKSLEFITEKLNGLPAEAAECESCAEPIEFLRLARDVVVRADRWIGAAREAMAARLENSSLDVVLVDGTTHERARVVSVDPEMVRLGFADGPEVRVATASISPVTFAAVAPIDDVVAAHRIWSFLYYGSDDFLEVFRLAELLGSDDPWGKFIAMRAEAADAVVNQVTSAEERALFEAFRGALADYRGRRFPESRERLKQLMSRPEWTSTKWYAEKKKQIVAIYEEVRARVDIEDKIGVRRGRVQVVDWHTRSASIFWDFTTPEEIVDFRVRPEGAEIKDGTLRRTTAQSTPVPAETQPWAVDVPIDPTAGTFELDLVFRSTTTAKDPARCLTITFFGQNVAFVSRLRQSSTFLAEPLHGLEKAIGETIEIGAVVAWQGDLTGVKQAMQSAFGRDPKILIDPDRSYAIHIAVEPKDRKLVVSVDGKVLFEETLKGIATADGEIRIRESRPHAIESLRVKGIIRR
jgi:tRNA A-37 threonylcarbamoyl transferase component Bud32